jgi:hypothetical protein
MSQRDSYTGLTQLEEKGYSSCNKLSCLHESCIKKYHNTVANPTRSKIMCGDLFDEWKACYKKVMEKG